MFSQLLKESTHSEGRKAESCKDGGTCHHDCRDGCFRKKYCVPLSGSGFDDNWEPKYWVLSTKNGYVLRSYNGTYLRYENMAVNMKSYIMAMGIKATVISSRTSADTIKEFEQSTGLRYVRKT